jgi:hypothetical protein
VKALLNNQKKIFLAYLLKARTVALEKQPLLGNGFVTRNN